ncbi:unnamed protein product [Trichobilharzia regenti]|nr:unnamed protein product [Trichobilharzia regenti]
MQIQFLVNTDYCSSTPEASLTLNSKEIFSIFEHVIRQIDPSFRIKGGVMKPEEVLVSTLKKLGYPNPLSKLHLVAPGAPQAWNSIVTALNWLREGVEHAKQLSEFSIPVAEGDGNANEKASVNKLIHELKLSLFKKKRGDPNITDSVIQVCFYVKVLCYFFECLTTLYEIDLLHIEVGVDSQLSVWSMMDTKDL